jgi:hypothetical protein
VVAGGAGEVGDDGTDVAALSWAAVRRVAGGSGGVGEEKMGLGAGEVGAKFASTALCGGENGSSGEGGDETELGAGAGDEWSGVQRFGIGGRCGVSSKEGASTGDGESAVVGLGSDQIGGGGECGGGDRCRSSSSPTPAAAPPRSVFLPLFLSASQAEARGAAKSRAAMAEVVRPAGARAGSEVLGMVSALQNWRPVHVDVGVCGGVSGLWR